MIGFATQTHSWSLFWGQLKDEGWYWEVFSAGGLLRSLEKPQSRKKQSSERWHDEQ